MEVQDLKLSQGVSEGHAVSEVLTKGKDYLDTHLVVCEHLSLHLCQLLFHRVQTFNHLLEAKCFH